MWSPGFTTEAPFDELPLAPFIRGQHVGAVVDTEDHHLVGVLEVLQQLKNQKKLWALTLRDEGHTHTHTNRLHTPYFRCNEEVLGRRFLAGRAHHNVENSSLIHWIHSLPKSKYKTSVTSTKKKSTVLLRSLIFKSLKVSIFHFFQILYCRPGMSNSNAQCGQNFKLEQSLGPTLLFIERNFPPDVTVNLCSPQTSYASTWIWSKQILILYNT